MSLLRYRMRRSMLRCMGNSQGQIDTQGDGEGGASHPHGERDSQYELSHDLEEPEPPVSRRRDGDAGFLLVAEDSSPRTSGRASNSC